MGWLYGILWVVILDCAGHYQYECDYTPKPHQQEALELARTRYEEYIGWPGVLGDSVPDVGWCSGRCPQQSADDTRNAIWHNGVCAAGITDLDGDIIVADWGKIGGTALAHEVGHWALLKLGIDGDARHQFAEWWAVSEVIDAEYRLEGW